MYPSSTIYPPVHSVITRTWGLSQAPDVTITLTGCMTKPPSNFIAVYDLICELVGSPVGEMSSNVLEKIFQANILSEIKGQYIAELSGKIVGFIY